MEQSFDWGSLMPDELLVLIQQITCVLWCTPVVFNVKPFPMYMFCISRCLGTPNTVDGEKFNLNIHSLHPKILRNKMMHKWRSQAKKIFKTKTSQTSIVPLFDLESYIICPLQWILSSLFSVAFFFSVR